MPEIKEMKIEKVYFKIKEVAQALDLPQSKIRFWMGELNIEVKRTGRRYRLFTQRDIDTLRIVNWLLKDVLFTVEGAKKQIEQHGTNRLYTEMIKYKSKKEELKKYEFFKP